MQRCSLSRILVSRRIQRQAHHQLTHLSDASFAPLRLIYTVELSVYNYSP